MTRVDPFSFPIWQRVEALNRTGVTSGQGLPEYQATPVEARDQAMIEQFGLRVGSTITAHEICDLNVASIVAQTILQRGLYVRTQYKFDLGWEFCLLDPMDIVTLSDANLGLNGALARIVEIEEDDQGKLSILAEELVVGVRRRRPIPPTPRAALRSIWRVSAAAVNTPLIFEPPPQLTRNNVAEIWLGASGGTARVADPNWGGCVVWAKLDNRLISASSRSEIRFVKVFSPRRFRQQADMTSRTLLGSILTESAGALGKRDAGGGVLRTNPLPRRR